MAIILVNLTFADTELRKELVTKANIELIESLSFALRVASFTQEEYDTRQPLSVPNEHDQYTPSYLLSAIMEEDLRSRPALNELDYNATHYHSHDLLVDPAHMLFPETARWCLSALKNLSRPSKDSPSAAILVNSGIMHLIMRYVSIGGTRDTGSPVVQTSETYDFQGLEFQSTPDT